MSSESKELEEFLVDLNKAAIEPLLLEEVSDSLEVTSKQFEIMFDIKLYTSTEADSSIYIDQTEKPKITIDYFKDKDVKEYKSFNNLESLTDNFYKKIKDERNPNGKLQFLSVFRSNYKPVGGTSTDSTTSPLTSTFYKLNIQYSIAIKLQISKRKTIAQEYLLKIIQLETVVDSTSTKRTLDYVGSNKDKYAFDLKDLKPDDRDKIKENIKKILESKKENEMINLNIESSTSDIPKLIDYLSENTYDISNTDEDANYSEWLNFNGLKQLKESITSQSSKTVGGSTHNKQETANATGITASTSVTNSSDIDLEIVKDYIYKLLGYEFLRIDQLLMIFNTDIFIKLFSILSNEKYVSKYTEILKFVYLRINIKNLEKIYEKPNKIYDIIDANTLQYDKLIAKIESNIKPNAETTHSLEVKGGTTVSSFGKTSFTATTAATAVSTATTATTATTTTVPATATATTATVSTDSLTDPKYIFSYLLFKKLFNDFFGIETSNAKYSDGYTSINGMGYNDDNVKPLRIMLSIILKIEKNVLSILDIFRENLGILKNIDKDFVNLSTEIKKVVSIVKRRHDYYEYDETHPLYKTQKSTYQNKLHYLDVYYINNPELKELFTYYDPYGRFKLAHSTDDTYKSELTAFRTNFAYADRSGNTVLEEDKPDYFYEKETSQVQGGTANSVAPEAQVVSGTPVSPDNLKPATKEIQQLKSGEYNERHKFGPFDYLYNEDKVLNSKIAGDIGPQLTKQLEENTIMMNGFGQSGSGKTSTLIKLVTTGANGYSEDGVLIEYLKKLGGKISSIKIECVNLYYKELDGKPIGMYNAFTKENYSVEIYDQQDVVKKDLRELNQSPGEKIVFEIKFTDLDNYNATISTVGDEILKLFERRQVLPTPNNDKSSRSHIIICLTFGAELKEGFITDTSFAGKKIIVCDLAGVENEFKCANQQELMKFDVKYDMIIEKKDNDTQALSAYNQLELEKLNTIEGFDCVKKSIEFLRKTANFEYTKEDGSLGYNFDVIKGIDNFPDIIKKLTEEFEKTKTDLKGVIVGTVTLDDGESTTDYVDNIKNLGKLLAKFLTSNQLYKFSFFDPNDETTIISNILGIAKSLSLNLKINPSEESDSVIIDLITKSGLDLSKFEEVTIFVREIQNSQSGIDRVKRELENLTNEKTTLEIKRKTNINDKREIEKQIINYEKLLRMSNEKKTDKNNLFVKTPKKTVSANEYNANFEKFSKLNNELQGNSFDLNVIEEDIKKNTDQIAEKQKELTEKETETTTMKLNNLMKKLKESLIKNLESIKSIQEKKATAVNDVEAKEKKKRSDIELLTNKQTEYDLVIKCVTSRYAKIQEDCSKRLKEGYMINRSLTELSKGISKIVEETASNGGLPIYIDKQIDPKCRNNFLDYYTFDQFSKESATIDANDIMKNYEKYGVILCILKYHYKIDLNKLVFYNLLVYNTSFFSKSSKIYTKQGRGATISKENTLDSLSYPKRHDDNFGTKNNPPDPPYVNINILKYFTRIHKNKRKLEKVLDLFLKYVNKYDFYKKNALPTGDSVFDKANNWIIIIERNNSATLIGTLETTDLLQTVAFKDVGCNLTFESTDVDYKEMIDLFNSTTSSILTNCKDSVYKSVEKYFGNEKGAKLNKLTEYLKETLFQERKFEGKVTDNKKGGFKTLRKENTKRKTMKRKILKTRRLHRKTKLRRTYKK